MDLSKVNIDILRSASLPVTTAKEARDVIFALEEEFLFTPNSIGLAAPQIGINKSVAIVRSREHGVVFDLINPKIVSTENPMVSLSEGCLSFPGRRFNVNRFKTVRIEYDRIWMPSGKWQYSSPPSRPSNTEEDLLIKSEACFVYEQEPMVFGGIICLAVQHEIDHLLGICLPFKESSIEVPYTEDGIRASHKVGRNDPCPCGLLKPDGTPMKYKKCCMGKS